MFKKFDIVQLVTQAITLDTIAKQEKALELGELAAKRREFEEKKLQIAALKMRVEYPWPTDEIEGVKEQVKEDLAAAEKFVEENPWGDEQASKMEAVFNCKIEALENQWHKEALEHLQGNYASISDDKLSGVSDVGRLVAWQFENGALSFKVEG